MCFLSYKLINALMINYVNMRTIPMFSVRMIFTLGVQDSKLPVQSKLGVAVLAFYLYFPAVRVWRG